MNSNYVSSMVGNNQRINSFLHNLFLGEEEMEALMYVPPPTWRRVYANDLGINLAQLERNEDRGQLAFEYVYPVSYPILSSHPLIPSSIPTFHYPLQPRQPQWMHSTIVPSANCFLGTLQMHMVPKAVSLGCMQRKQQRRSYPGLRHLAIKCLSAIPSARHHSYSSRLMA